MAIWMFPKIVGFPPKSSNFNRVFHYFHHPFWDTPISGNTHLDLKPGTRDGMVRWWISSLSRLLEAMKDAGYDVGDLPQDCGVGNSGWFGMDEGQAYLGQYAGENSIQSYCPGFFFRIFSVYAYRICVVDILTTFDVWDKQLNITPRHEYWFLGIITQGKVIHELNCGVFTILCPDFQYGYGLKVWYLTECKWTSNSEKTSVCVWWSSYI